ncbi:hypothetical protein GSS87_05775 [Corynebacterium sp. 4HC-13]|uniref:hypothetical protein n=1 Tax=Corynebacterium anserum TaxID=2684406 RepID=UPI0016394F4D|nr:hypothetical protein [Corynebacterium anserum]MBC2681904.1 hypothetical protein [Corynebacterium anserum]
MSNFIVILHVLAAILLIGPVAVSTSMFAPQLRKVDSGSEDAGTLRLLHSITRVYGLISLIVPTLGLIAMFTVDGAMKNPLIHTGLLLSIIAWVILVFLIIPRQRLALLSVNALTPADTPASEKETAALHKVDTAKLPAHIAMFGGIFNLLWFITALLMFFA